MFYYIVLFAFFEAAAALKREEIVFILTFPLPLLSFNFLFEGSFKTANSLL